MREYPVTVKGGGGDIDSGPVVFGLGLSPTGFMIAGSRIHGDQNAFRRFFATAYAWGAPLERDQELHFVTGGPLGDSILFAMLTACNPRTLRDPATPVPQGSLEGIGGRAFTSQEGRAPSRPDK